MRPLFYGVDATTRQTGSKGKEMPISESLQFEFHSHVAYKRRASYQCDFKR